MKTYEVFELTLTASVAGASPYLDGPMVSARFTGESGPAAGQVVDVRGFWDGSSRWKIRFAPYREGEWSFLTVSSDPGLAGQSGSITAVPPTADDLAANRLYHGHVVANPAQPYSLMHADGTPFFFMGDTQWSFSTSAIAWSDEFQTYVDARSDQGFNYIHGVVYQLYPSGNDRNEGGQAFTSNDVDRLNPGFWQAFDQRVAYMNQKGIVAGLVLAWANEGWDRFQTTDQVERFAQYLIDRYAAYNVLWVLEGEYEESDLPGGHNNLGNYFLSNDPYQHIRTMHTVDTSADDFAGQAWHTLVYQQTSSLSMISADRIHGLPVVNSEFGYEGSYSGDAVRRRAWEIVMRGGFFVYGNTATYHHDASMTSANLYSTGAVSSAHLHRFFTGGIRWWEMQPDHSVLTGLGNYALVTPGAEYIVLMLHGGSTVLDLQDAPGQFEVEWYDPRTGQYQAGNTVFGGTSVAIAAPNADDWVVRLSLFGEGTPTATAPSPSPTETSTPTPSPSASPPATSTPTPTAIPTQTRTATPTPVPSATVPPSSTPTPFPTSTITPTPTAPMTPTATPASGDLNGDGHVNVLDVQLCINVFVGLETDPTVVARADVNGDGAVNVLDVQLITNLYLAG